MRGEGPALKVAVAVLSLWLFLLFSYLMFPVARIDSIIATFLSRQGLTLSPQAGKTLLPGLVWKEMTLSSEQGALLKCDTLRVRALALPLLAGKAVVTGNAVIGPGNVAVRVGLNGPSALGMSADDIPLSGIPFFKNVLGAKASGTLWSRGELKRSARGVSGDIRLEVRQLEFSGVKLGAFPLPDAANLKTQGMIKVTDGKARLESFTLESDGIYMRLSGDIPTGANAGVMPLAMNMEIMPKPDFLEKQKLVFMVLAKFMTSPGVYSVPIRGTLLKPQIL